MSNLEWMQLRHYDRWRKHIQDDPYKALFGASNDMLSGKGLMDWEWVHKSFPKWMLNEMEVDEKPQVKSEEKTKYPKKVEVRDEGSENMPKAREPLFPEPSFRKTAFERDVSAGIVSPSDLRRPRESSHVKVVGHGTPGGRVSANASAINLTGSAPGSTSVAPESNHDTSKSIPSSADNHVEETKVRSIDRLSQQEHEAIKAANERLRATLATLEDIYQKNGDIEEIVARQHAAIEANSVELERINAQFARERPLARDTTFMRSFLKESLPEKQSHDLATTGNKSWRQTALQRRAASKVIAEPQPRSSLMSTPSKNEVLSIAPVVSEPSLQATESVPEEAQPTKTVNKNVEWLLQQESDSALKEASSQEKPATTRSSTEILKQLPEDDIDFLSAADIRASMGAKRSQVPTDEQRQAARQSLEDAFATIPETPNVDPMVEAQIINNQHVRRKAREMEAAQAPKETETLALLDQQVAQAPTAEAPMESSIDRMKKWLETTGASFARQFWQDPTEEADVTKTKLFFDKVANYLKKGQAATRHITEDLEKDVPASKTLLKRLKTDEQLLDSAIHRLRQRTPSGSSQGLSPRKIRAMESLKTRFHQTNNELEKAYEALRVIASAEAATNATGSFKRRLTAASKVLHKNSQLLRMLVWSLQTRLEDSQIDRNILSNYKVVADNLLSLRDTQMTLMRLVDRAMLVYGVVPNAAEDIDAIKAEQEAEYSNCEDPFVRARLAADAHLINEIKAHKSVKEAVASTKIAAEPKSTTSTTLDEPSPLAHSLFRPFGPVIDKLGSKEVREAVAAQVEEDERRKLSDKQLVDEIKEAYEDSYGTITAEHQQAPELKVVDEDVQRPIQMLKDDPEASAVSSYQDTSAMSVQETPKILPAQDGVVDVEETNGTDKQILASEEPTRTTTQDESFSPSQPAAEPTPTVEPAPSVISAQSTENLPTHYTIVVRDPQTDTLSITTSSTGPPRDTSRAIPLHQALSSLDSPAKFVPYITSGLEVVSAKKDILVLRDAVDNTAATRPFETVRTPSSSNVDAYVGSNHVTRRRADVNPIDGTTRLSPTGYVGPEESAEQLEKEFEARRRAAGYISEGHTAEQQRKDADEAIGRGRKMVRRQRAGSVVKTAIWVAGMCYVAGVVSEIVTSTV
jgi:hypothetical protein